MVTRFDHVTVVVRDMKQAKRFFELLGFEEDKSVVICGGQFGAYMDVPGIEAEHVTLALMGAPSRTELQLLKFNHPQPLTDPHIRDLFKIGFNHICFAVDDIEAEIERLTANGVTLRNQIMEFHNRKLGFLAGPEGITVELAQWL